MAKVSLKELYGNAEKRRAEITSQMEARGYILDPSTNKFVRDPSYTAPVSQTEIGNIQAKSAAETQANQEDLLSPTEAGTLGVPYGTKKKEAIGKIPMTTDERNKQVQSKKAISILNQIEGYSKKVNTFNAKQRLAGAGFIKQLGAVTQLDTNASLLLKQRGKLSNLVRALGEVGALAEGDVQRAIDLIPRPSDSKEIAQANLLDLRELLEENLKGSPQTQPAGRFKVEVVQ